MSKTEFRRFDTLRSAARKQQPETVTQKAARALHNIAESENGQHIRNFLAAEIFDTSDAPSESAWMKMQARRQFAEQLLAMMDGKHGKRSSGSGSDRRNDDDTNG